MKYTTIAVLQLPVGVVLGLTEAQAARRRTMLSAVPARKGWYTTTAPVQFKRGEELLCDDELPKNLAQFVEDRAAPAAKHKAKAPAPKLAPEQG